MMTLRMLIHSFFSNNHIILNTMDFEYFSKKKKKNCQEKLRKIGECRSFLLKLFTILKCHMIILPVTG